MKYSDFLKTNSITQEQVWGLLSTRCQSKAQKDQLLQWWKTGMEKTPSSEKYSRYEQDLQNQIKSDTQDADAMFLATLGSWRNWERKVDCPSMEELYHIEAEY